MKIALLGYGRMGREVERVAIEGGHEVVLRLDIDDNPGGTGITAEAFAGVDVAIDFTAPAAVFADIERLTEIGTPLVVGTTGWDARTAEARRLVEERDAALVHGANLSVGANLFFRIAAHAAGLFDALGGHTDHDPYVFEHHHRHKADAPSGTALHVARLVLENSSRKRALVCGDPGGPIDPEALHIGVLRAGTAFGEHTVGFDGAADSIRITHTARGREGFARGAVLAAAWIAVRKGFFEFSEVLDEILGNAGDTP